MSQLDNSVIIDLSLNPVPGPIELPLYARYRPETRIISGVPRTRSVARDVSQQELFAVLLQLTDMRRFRRFLAMPLLVSAYDRRSGPARETFFSVPVENQGLDQALDYPKSFRNELSLAHSDLFFLKPHALVLSALEDKDALEYFDPIKYQQACLTYPNNTCPLDDLDRCFLSNHQSWAHLYRNKGLIN